MQFKFNKLAKMNRKKNPILMIFHPVPFLFKNPGRDGLQGIEELKAKKTS